MQAFQTAEDIANRALQRVGARRITLLTDNSKEAAETSACYDKLRRAELRRNVWRFSIRRVILRAIGTTLPTWDSAVTYANGAYVTLDSVNYVSQVGSNLNNDPSTDDGTHWLEYDGVAALKIVPSAWDTNTSYSQGAVVTGSDGYLYLSMAGSNGANDPTTDDGTLWTLYFGPTVASAWDTDTTYSVGEVVFSLANNVYYSTINGNDNDPTASNSGWVQISGTASPLILPWPAGTGPVTEQASNNVFVLPTGFLRRAPESPRAGDTSVLGFPSNLTPVDWVFEGNYIVSSDPGPIMLRFAADVRQVTQMDDLFCEGLASRIALEVCEILTQSSAKLKDIASEYKQFMGEARTVNGIETGATQPYLDDLIACRA